MFDIGFVEIVLIAVVSLLVLGPDKLPGAIRTAGLWIGRLKRSFNNIRSEIEREVGADEIRRQLRNEAIMEKIKNTKGQFTESIQSVKDEAQAMKDSVNIKKELSPFTNKPDGSNSDAAESKDNTPGFDPAGNASGQASGDNTNTPDDSKKADTSPPATDSKSSGSSDSSDTPDTPEK